MKASIAFLAITVISITTATHSTHNCFREYDRKTRPSCQSLYPPDEGGRIQGRYAYQNCSQVPQEVIDVASKAIEDYASKAIKDYLEGHVSEIFSVTGQLVNGLNYGVITSVVTADGDYECKAGVYHGPFSNSRNPSTTLTESGVCCFEPDPADMVRRCHPSDVTLSQTQFSNMIASITCLAITLISITTTARSSQNYRRQEDIDSEKCQSLYLPPVPDYHSKDGDMIIGGHSYQNCSQVPREVIDVAAKAIEDYVEGHVSEIFSITGQVVNGVNYGVIASVATAEGNYECKAGVYYGPFSNTDEPLTTLKKDGVCCFKREAADMERHCLSFEDPQLD
ncbi:hypothetical protein BGZ70_010398 [Mortierella alpina]|uniref:Uncharacterized protein n=1 Tax=Mortierella alpina TaxID=64518 RepID=A0A9P6IZ89_MORAP|nr:hypothetical protein BGZ70_010398 [Mortierella alpina]